MTEEGLRNLLIDISEAIIMAVDAIDEKDKLSAESEKVRHWRHYENMLSCPECGAEYYDEIMYYCGDDVPKYCPLCGCKMTASPTGAERSEKE